MQEALTRIVDPLLVRMDGVFGSGYSAILYGSGARGEYLAGVSDVNLLVVCEQLGPAVLRALYPALAGLRDARQSPPLLIEREEWRRAGDVFPIEMSDMQHARTVLRGEDPVAGVPVDRRHLRRALEAELRAKLLRLRQTYALRSAEPRALGTVARDTASTVAALFRGALLLSDGHAPETTPACLEAAQAALGVSTVQLGEFWRRRGDPKYTCPPEMFEEYLSSVAALIRVIDQFTIPGGD